MTAPHVSRLTVSEPGLLGLVGSVELSRLTLLIGPNGAGKTRIARAYDAGVMGVRARPAEYGTKSNEINPPRVYIADPPEGTAITLTLSTGASHDRLITTGKGSTSETERADATADDLFGRRLIDTATLAGCTVGQARAAVAACLSRGGLCVGWTVAEAVENVRGYMLAKLGEVEQDAPTATIWTAPLVKLHADMPRAPVTGSEDDGGTWLAKVEPLSVDRQKAARAAKDAADKVWKQSQKAPPKAPPEDRGKAKSDHRAAVSALSTADNGAALAARFDADLAAWTDNHRRLSDALAAIVTEGKERREALDALRAAPLPEVEPHLLAELDTAKAAPLPTMEEPAALYREAVTAARAALDAPIPGPDAAEVARLEGLIRVADAEVARLAGEIERLTAEHNGAATAEETATDDVSDTQGSVDDVDERIRQHRADLAALESLHANGSCKTCGDVDPYGLHGRAEAIRVTLAEAEKEQAARLAILSDARDAHTAAAASLTAAGIALDAATDAHDLALRLAADDRAALARLADPAQTERIRAAQRADLTRVEENYRQERRRLDAVHLAAALAHGDRIMAAEAAITRRCESIAATRAAEVAAADAALVSLRASHTQAKARLDACPPAPVAPSTEPVDRAALSADVARCEAIEHAWTLYDQAMKQHREAEAAAQSTRLTYAAAESLTLAIRLATEELGRVAIAPIQRAIDEVTADIPGDARAYYAGPSDFGVVHPDGCCVRLHDSSGAERLIATVALDVAFARLQGCPVPYCILDEIGRVQPGRVGDVLRALSTAIERGHIAQALVTMPADDAPTEDEILSRIGTVPGMGVVRVRPQSPAAAPTVAPASPAAVVGEQSDLPF